MTALNYPISAKRRKHVSIRFRAKVAAAKGLQPRAREGRSEQTNMPLRFRRINTRGILKQKVEL